MAKRIKTPAFQFYPKDWLSDLNVQQMDWEEQGKYIHLLATDWNNDGIPKQYFERVKGSSRVLEGLFVPHPKDSLKVVNKRLEKERVKQSQWRAKCAEGGKKSGKARKAKALQNEGYLKGSSRVVEGKGNTSSTSSSTSTTADIIYTTDLSNLKLEDKHYQALLLNHYFGNDVLLKQHIEEANSWLKRQGEDLIGDRAEGLLENWKRNHARFSKGGTEAVNENGLAEWQVRLRKWVAEQD